MTDRVTPQDQDPLILERLEEGRLLLERIPKNFRAATVQALLNMFEAGRQRGLQQALELSKISVVPDMDQRIKARRENLRQVMNQMFGKDPLV